MMRRLRTCVLIVSSTLLLSLCLVSAEEQKSNLESKNILSENNSTKIEENESKPEIEHHHNHLDHQDHNLNELKTDEHNNSVHDDNHVQDDHHDHVDGHVQDASVDDEDDHVHDGKIVEPSVDRDDLITIKKDVHADVPTKIPPPWDPLSSVGKPPPTRPPYRVSFTPYTTPTPLPNRPDWKKSDWLNYFKTNHPNFWFINELKKNYTEEHGIKPEEEEAPWVSVDHEKAGSYFPGFPAYSIVPGPDRHRVSYRPGPGHISVISSPFLYNNQVKLKSENIRKKEAIFKGSKNETNLVINLYRKPLENSSKNPNSRESADIPILRRKKRSGQKSEDERFLFFLNNQPQDEEDLGKDLGSIENASLNKVPNSYLNMEAQNPPEFVTPSKLLIKQSNLGPLNTGMGESYQGSRFQNLPPAVGNEQDARTEQLLKQQQDFFMFQLKQQQQQQLQQQQQNLQQQQVAFNPQYPPPYWYNPFFYPPYFQQQQPSGGASTSTSCSSSGCTSAAAAGSSTSTSTSSGGPSTSQRKAPARRRNGNRQRTTTTEAPDQSTTTRRSTSARTTTTTTTTSTTTTTTQASNGGLNLNSRPNFNNQNTATSESTTESSTTTTTTTRAPFSIRFGKREAHREDDEEEEEPFYDYDIPTNQDGYKFQRHEEPFEPPQQEFEHQLEQMIGPEAIQPMIPSLPTTNQPSFNQISNNFLPRGPNQIFQEILKPTQEPWHPKESSNQVQEPYHQPKEPNHQPQESYNQHHGVPQPPQIAQPYLVKHQQQPPMKPPPRLNKPPQSKSFMQTLKEHLQPSKPYQKANKPIKPGKPYPLPPAKAIYQPLQETEPLKTPLDENDYTQSEEPLHLTPDTEEAPSSLQTILSSHQIKTNFLKTPPRTEHFGYQSVEHQPKIYQPSNMMTLQTPKEEVEHYPSHYQEIAERFYTTSSESKIGPSLGSAAQHLSYAQDEADDRHDTGNRKVDVGRDDEVEGKENPLVNTAVIALKLSSKILDLYKTVSPYLPQ